MNVKRVFLLSCLLAALLLAPTALAHETKEYTIILHSEGHTPNDVRPGVVFDTDSLFFRNEDSRESAEHRILIDADGDGNFSGVDDIATAWLSTSCELNETGERIDADCQAAALVSLAAEDGLLPGNISMIHEVKFNDSVEEYPFFASFSQDVHQEPGPDQVTPQPPIEEKSSKEKMLEWVILASVLVAFFVASELLRSDEEE